VYFLLIVLLLSLPVQVIAWKDSSPKWPIMCRAGRKTLLTHCYCQFGFLFSWPFSKLTD